MSTLRTSNIFAIKIMAKHETAQIIAELCWYHNTTAKNLSMHLNISEADVHLIRGSDEYLAAVENLMRTTRSPEDIVKWIQGYENMPRRFGRRMGLSEAVVEELIEKILNG